MSEKNILFSNESEPIFLDQLRKKENLYSAWILISIVLLASSMILGLVSIACIHLEIDFRAVIGVQLMFVVVAIVGHIWLETPSKRNVLEILELNDTIVITITASALSVCIACLNLSSYIWIMICFVTAVWISASTLLFTACKKWYPVYQKIRTIYS